MVSREASAPPSEGDTIDDHVDETKPSLEDLDQDHDDNRDETPVRGTPENRRGGRLRTSTGKRTKSKKAAVWIQEQPADGTEDEGSVLSVSHSRTKKSEATPESEPRTVGTAVGTRRQANGTVGSVYSGSKIRHIKKADGTPLWRKEIQYEFLRIVIDDTQPVFTRISDGKVGCNFADIYIDCMARSSKTSKILKDRLQVDRQAAQNMAMICLLVNVGRMNTTLNFFPEMRAQLRTYHSIPSLQAYPTQKDYKSLQDAPRLKSILKGASEDTDEPRSIPAIKAKAVPRTNPVNLIFVLSQFAPKISETHFADKVDFFDLAMRHTISSATRARAFLWLMWWYLESSFTKEDALNNPFGAGRYKEDQDAEDPEAIPELVPLLTTITPEEGDAENVDTPIEIEFADKMTEARKKVMLEAAAEQQVADPDVGHKGIKRLKKSAAMYEHDDLMSDADSRASPGFFGRSPAPDSDRAHVVSSLGAQADSLDNDWEAHDAHPGRGRYKRVRGKNTPTRTRGGGRVSEGGRSLLRSSRKDDTPDTDRYRGTPQPLQPGGGNHPIISQFGSHRAKLDTDAMMGRGEYGAPKSRARTGYQRELEEHRQRRVEWALRKRRRAALKEFREMREGGRWILRAARRIVQLPSAYDSDGEDADNGSIGVTSILGRRWRGENTDEAVPSGYEEEDYGEEAESWSNILRRTGRRLEVWEGDRDVAVLHARVRHAQMGEASLPRKGLANGTRKPHRIQGVRPPTIADSDGPDVTTLAGRKDLNDEITQDLLAERSDEDMDDDESVEGNGEAEQMDSDVEMD